ncbi:charged multivesicular body protein 7 [Geosmithia morbida]|uniref:Charged multivesicular body protein 7 n=1 Tax=Geosmithia morbida TaxID=1094350 RepID=A0A9P4Z153_9HYPO|nr:charged multivesicular body protein 7 [Geosmithia morbida]KAF4125368.1 charged multivesicular body protein 7 [Geosmithia morbida]
MGELFDYLAEHDSNFRKGRLPALYSDFRSQQTLNPDGYQANLSAWRHALSHLASQGLLARHTNDSSTLVAKVDGGLLEQLESKQYGQPLALGTVVRDAVSARELVDLQEFKKAPQSIYRRGWGVVPWSVLGWTMRQLGVTDPARGEDTLPTGQYVVLENLEGLARELSERMAGKTLSMLDRVFTRKQFQQVFVSRSKTLSDQDMDLFLLFLSRDKGMIAYDGQTLRFKDSSNPSPTITEQDTTVASIKDLSATLRHQVDLLNDRVDDLEIKAKTAVARKNRVAALAALKSKKQTESTLASRYATLAQLEAVSVKIEQAADHVTLVKVMESSTGVLRDLNAQIGGAERVDGVMDSLREKMADTDEIAGILADSNVAVDEDELDDELDAMEAQEKAARREEEDEKDAREALEKIGQLPGVPVEEEDLLRGEKEQSPTTTTGIANLSVRDEPQRERA